ncbi:MAG: TSUP family transporter [Crocinitomicaceae bacterium]|nr:TSUP family transporter [Crocinitomicaceae bacterium]MDG1659138.1 TSUP family transporter [Crocinitomicaceae bacterium]
MTTQTIMILIIIGLMAGALSGFVGVGGGVVIVPALIYTLGMGQFNAQGTSLFILLLPVGIMAFYNYAKHDHVNWKFGIIVALSFVIGGYVGSKIALKISPSIIKIIFGLVMGYVSIRMIMSGLTSLPNDT